MRAPVPRSTSTSTRNRSRASGVSIPPFAGSDDRPYELVHLLLRQVHDIPSRDSRHANLARIERRQPEDFPAELEKRSERIEDRGDSGLATPSLVHTPPQAQDVPHIQAGHRQVPDIADHPVERLSVPRKRRGRSPHLAARPLHKRGSSIPMVTDDGSS